MENLNSIVTSLLKNIKNEELDDMSNKIVLSKI